MKKTILLITSLVFLTTIAFSQSKVNINNLVQYGDKMFKENDDKPYAGMVFDLYKSNGNKKLEGRYKDGLRNGKWSWWNEVNTMDSSGTYKDGKYDGLWTWWYENGQKHREETWRVGERNGLFTEWYENGKKEYEWTYKDGKQDGLFTEWYENGQKEWEGTFKHGKEDGLSISWYKNGQKRMEIPYKDGKRDGLLTWWYENGQKYRERTYKEGTYKDGLVIEWHENGQKRMEETWKDWEMISIKCWDENGDDNNCGELILAVISLVQAKQLFDDGILFVDARDDVYYSKGHIQGAMKNAFLMELIVNIEARQSKAEPLVIYSSDPDNGEIEDLAYHLQDLGFTKLYVFKGGWLEWSKAGYPTK